MRQEKPYGSFSARCTPPFTGLILQLVSRSETLCPASPPSFNDPSRSNSEPDFSPPLRPCAIGMIRHKVFPSDNHLHRTANSNSTVRPSGASSEAARWSVEFRTITNLSRVPLPQLNEVLSRGRKKKIPQKSIEIALLHIKWASGHATEVVDRTAGLS